MIETVGVFAGGPEAGLRSDARYSDDRLESGPPRESAGHEPCRSPVLPTAMESPLRLCPPHGPRPPRPFRPAVPATCQPGISSSTLLGNSITSLARPHLLSFNYPTTTPSLPLPSTVKEGGVFPGQLHHEAHLLPHCIKAPISLPYSPGP